MEAIGTLAGGIAHDFNNILSAILGFTELSLDETETDSSIHANLQEVLRAGLRAKDLVNQILTFARQSEIKVKPIQVSKVAKEVLKLIRASIPASIKIVEHIKTDTMIMADPTQIHQIMMNLCTNAAYAMKTNGGTLMIMIEEVMLDGKFAAVTKGVMPGIHIRITVTDTGEGISPDVMDMIFEPYYTTKPFGEGTGLGLSLIHGIVREHGGAITVNSEKTKGSSFKIYLPVIRGKTEKEIIKKKIIPVGSERILFVDDELQLVKLGGRMLESLGYRVSGRTSSIEALQVFKAMPDKYDLVITDMSMPNMTGDQLAKRVMEIKPDYSGGYMYRLQPHHVH
ncbi:MAG: ATP-binding protein [Desulfobacteraceae bacterium]|jgi:nitrogen-specific signal transduction histidine kinase|nr:ATP-binding protein [Desulfobacteraceae bacterium]